MADEYEARYQEYHARLARKEAVRAGDTPAQRVMSHNWAVWCALAARATFFCSCCNLPMDPPDYSSTGAYETDRKCAICREMILVLNHRPYWTRLNSPSAEAERRRRLGLE